MMFFIASFAVTYYATLLLPLRVERSVIAMCAPLILCAPLLIITLTSYTPI